MLQSPFFALAEAGVFDLAQQSPRDPLHLIPYNLFRSFVVHVQARYMSPMQLKEFDLRTKAISIPHNWAPLTFTVNVRIRTFLTTTNHKALNVVLFGQFSALFSMDIYSTLLYTAPFLFKGLVPYVVLEAIVAMGELFNLCSQHTITWAASKSATPLARYAPLW